MGKEFKIENGGRFFVIDVRPEIFRKPKEPRPDETKLVEPEIKDLNPTKRF